jgi:phospholipid/cholesterol/gamma-HCH transport system permease protein
MIEPSYTAERSGAAVRLALTGSWTIAGSQTLETEGDELAAESRGARRVTFDLARLEGLDTAGAWLIDRARASIEGEGAETDVERARPEHAILLEEAHWRDFGGPRPRHRNVIVTVLADVGETVVGAGRDLVDGVAVFGEVVAALGAAALRPGRLRPVSIVYHMENFAFRSVPIVALINFLVGCIVSQQAILQLRQFGATTFSVDLISILVLRELAVLLTSIMVAGRSGSSITAELGSMKMREEIDALRVMGLDPTETLVMPRVLALVLSVPLLTFVADLSALFGGLLVAWGYGGITPIIFLARLQDAIGLNTFFVGIIKAPVMALLIGMIAAIEGMAVQGSAESLGRQVTKSVVKSIFMVIVADGLFAIFFAAIGY